MQRFFLVLNGFILPNCGKTLENSAGISTGDPRFNEQIDGSTMEFRPETRNICLNIRNRPALSACYHQLHLSPQVQLICNVSTFVESLDPQQLQHFENFPDEPAFVGMPKF